MSFRSSFTALALGLVLAGVPSRSTAAAQDDGDEPDAERPNVLFVVIDDLRPELGCYGASSVKSPRLDAFAAESTVFTRAYCQQALCNPSRTSVLTGLRPETSGIDDLRTHFRTRLPDVVTLPQLFRLNGYRSVGMGKVFHTGLDDEASWSVPWTRPLLKPYRDPANQAAVGRNRAEARRRGKGRPAQSEAAKGPATEAADVADEEYYDGALASMAIEALRDLAARPEPFFLAVGFFRPHLPFNAPKRYWDLYDPAALPVAPRATGPDGAPVYALYGTLELLQYDDVPDSLPVDPALARRLVHGYHACVSYVDAQVGRVLDELERLGLADETIVVLWGDHGWKLGDYGAWGKMTDYEVDARTPLLMRVPGGKPATCSALVELVDVYPTLCDLAGLEAPAELEGTSFRPLLEDPGRAWKRAAFSSFPRRLVSGNDPSGAREILGVSMRTERYRMTVWSDAAPPNRLLKIELYDHDSDPGETVNVADDPERREVRHELRRELERGWRGALP